MGIGKRVNQTYIIRVVVNALIGVMLWITFAGGLSWFVSAEYIVEGTGVFAAPFAQGLVAYIITMITYWRSEGEKGDIPLLVPCLYFAMQLIVSLLFWNINLLGIARGAGAVACGMLVALLTYKLRRGPKRSKVFARYSR